jgi:protein phosphatase
MLRVAEQWFGTDVGRQRQGNEDSLFVQAPLFVVADGMGGAQAGEVASRLAVEAFHDGLPGPAPLEAMVAIIREANHRIHDRSRADAKHHGMGTTCTAAFVAADEVVLAHVGDSRCYLLRDGELTRLTRDHSLVGELVDRGKLTEEQAEVHPQRSVITRALGPEDQVEVDTERIEARDGDLFLLCSDGLTSMVREHDLVPILQGDGLERMGRELINAANAAGGRDNITVVLFRVGDVAATGAASRTDQTTERGAVSASADHPTTQSPAASRASDEQEAAYRSQGTVAMAALDPPPPAAPPAGPVPERTAPPPPPRARRGGRPVPSRRPRSRLRGDL